MTHTASLLRYFLPFTRYPYRGEPGDCPVCGTANHRRIARMDRKWKRHDTHICGDCGLFFTQPMPTDAELAAYYRDTYRIEYQLARLRPPSRHQAKKAKEAARRLAQIAQHCPLPPGTATLDFGCGSGELVLAMAAAGYQAHGFEPGESYAAHGQGAIRTGTWEEMDYAPGSFGLITCLHVVEHLRTPLAALRRMHAWLAPGGVLYLEVPNMQAYDPKGFERFHFAHVLGFSGANLGLAAQKAGFGLLAAPGPTSLFLADAADPRAKQFDLDLAATAERNWRDYSKPLGIATYLGYQARRARRLLTGGGGA